MVYLRRICGRQYYSAQQRIRRSRRQRSGSAEAANGKNYQAGSVLKLNRFTLDMDAYYVHFQNGYTSYTDITTGEPVYYATPPSNTKGIEAESNVPIRWGLSIYRKRSFGQAKYKSIPSYADGGRWVANTPDNVEGVSLLYQHQNWDVGLTYKRVGQYYNDNGTINQAIVINPWELVNVFANYTIKNTSHFRGPRSSWRSTIWRTATISSESRLRRPEPSRLPSRPARAIS